MSDDINITIEEVSENINITMADACPVQWGDISGDLTNQTDLQTVLDLKADTTEVEAMIAAIPVPDVSGQISTHNLSSTAHADIRTALDLKVDKVTGKGLSTNDLTDVLKSGYDDAVTKAHTHANKSILDNTTASFTTAQETLLSNQSGINTGDETQSTILDKIGYTPANDTTVVHLTGDESISGSKNFDSNTLFVDSVNHRVGIGMNNPGNLLHVYQSGTGFQVPVMVQNPGDPGNGSTRLVVQNSVSSFYLQAYGSSAPGTLARAASIWAPSGSKLLLGAGSGMDVQLVSNNDYGTPQFTLTSAGNVGIGTTNPALAKLQIEAGNGVVGQYINGGTTANIDLLKLRANASTQKLVLEGVGGTVQTFLEAGSAIGLFGTYTNHAFRIRTNYIDRMTFDTAGNVGIGTTNPTAKLHIYSADASPLRIERGSAANSTMEFKNTVNSMYAGVNPSGHFGIGNSMDLNTGYLTVLSSGNVGIGTNNPTSLVHIEGNYSGGSDNLIPQIKVINTATTISYAFIRVITGTGTTGGYPEFWMQAGGSNVDLRGVSNHDLRFWTNNTVKATLTKDGNVGIGTTNPTSKFEISENSISRYKISGGQTISYLSGTGEVSAQIVNLKAANVSGLGGMWTFNTNYDVASDFFGKFGYKFQGGTTDSFKQFQIYIADAANPKMVVTGAGNVGIGTTNPTSQITQKSTLELESAPLGSELLSGSNWTSTDWSGDFTNGFTHSTGNTTALSNSLVAVVNNIYQIAFTVTGRTAGTFTVSFGGVTSGAYSSSNAFGPKATSTGNLIVTPTSDFNGTVIISVKQITGSYSPIYALVDNAGSNTIEIRSSLATLNNTFIGKNAGRYNTTGSSNSAQGMYALYSNTTGSSNSAQGYAALYSNTTGSGNSAQGVNALYSNTTGSGNSAQGVYALYSNTTGYNNSAQGVNALYSNTTGYNNSAQGVNALYSNTTGSYNSAQGNAAGRYLADGTTGRTTGNNGLYLGYNSKASANGTENEIVIGASAIGKGSNTAIIGSSALTALYVSGQIVPATLSTAPTAIEGGIYYNTTDKHFYGYNGTTWKQLDN